MRRQNRSSPGGTVVVAVFLHFVLALGLFPALATGVPSAVIVTDLSRRLERKNRNAASTISPLPAFYHLR